ncbi:hypothetical protein ACHAXS_010398, partial [Conticribra weissflogii]
MSCSHLKSYHFFFFFFFFFLPSIEVKICFSSKALALAII